MDHLLLGYHLCDGEGVVMGVHHALGVGRCRVEVLGYLEVVLVGSCEVEDLRARTVVADNVYDLMPLEMACLVSLEGGLEVLLAGDSQMGVEQIDLGVGY